MYVSSDHVNALFSNSVIDSLIIDTGSSNTWVGAGKPYVKTSTSVQTKDRVVYYTKLDLRNDILIGWHI